MFYLKKKLIDWNCWVRCSIWTPISQKIKKVVQLANFSTREISQIEDVEEAIVGEKCAGSFNEKAFSEVTKRKSEAWVVLLRHSFSHFENRMNCHCILYNLAEIIANFVRHAIIENNIGYLWRKKGFFCVNWRSIKRCCSIVRTVFFDLKYFFCWSAFIKSNFFMVRSRNCLKYLKSGLSVNQLEQSIDMLCLVFFRF